MIQFNHVYKSYKNLKLFEDLTLSLEDGKKIMIKGYNGSGKSVLLKLIVGYAKPNKGSIIIDGDILGANHDFIQNAGVSINSPEMMNNCSGLDNLTELAKIRNVAKLEDIMYYVNQLELNDDINKKYKTYSLGMKQKLRIIQALMEDPKYLILDEPFDALDYHTQNKIKELLDDFVNSGKTLIFTSHNKEYEDFADIIYEIDSYTLNRVK